MSQYGLGLWRKDPWGLSREHHCQDIPQQIHQRLEHDSPKSRRNMTTQIKPSTSLYDQDFAAWADHTTQLLQERRFDQLDLEHLIEEVQDLSKRERQALYSNLKVLLVHLLKWQFQLSMRSNSWKASIVEHRQRVQKHLQDSPSLKPYLAQIFEDCYHKARLVAEAETAVPISVFPADCPYAIATVLEEGFQPDGSH